MNSLRLCPWFITIKVDQHPVLNGLKYEDLAVKYEIYILEVKK